MRFSEGYGILFGGIQSTYSHILEELKDIPRWSDNVKVGGNGHGHESTKLIILMIASGFSGFRNIQ